MNDYPICEHVDCVQPGEEYDHPSTWYGDLLDGAPAIQVLCDKHAKEFGYCLGCHQFFGGIESYEFSPIDGFCDECVEEFRYETGEYDDFEDELDEEYY